MALNFLHPLAITVYALIIVGFLCMISTKAGVAEFYPERSIQYAMDQARHIYTGKKSQNPVLQLNRYSSALAFIASARTLAPDTTTILKQTRINPTELDAAIHKAAKPLLKRAAISNDEFRATFS